MIHHGDTESQRKQDCFLRGSVLLWWKQEHYAI